MTRVTLLGTLIAVGGLSLAVSGQAPGPSAKAIAATKIEKVKDNLYIITGSGVEDTTAFSGGNVAVFITDGGVTLVDAKLPGFGPTIVARVKSVTNKPITRIINTHTHADHTGSNEFFGASIESIVQENTKANMAKMDAFKGDKAQFLPKRTYKDKMSVGSGKNRVDLYYFGAGHTNGDAWVVYPSLRVLQTGDMFAWRDAPTIDRNNGGSAVEYPKTLSRAVAGIKDVDTVIPGHSPVTTPKDLQEYQRFVTDWVAAVQSAAAAGKTVDDAVAAINLTSKYPGYKSERYKAAIPVVYAELKK